MDPTRDNPLLRFNTFWWAVWTFLMFAVLLAAVILFNRKPPSNLEDAAAVARYATKEKLGVAQAAALPAAEIAAAIAKVAAALPAAKPTAVELPEQVVPGSPTAFKLAADTAAPAAAGVSAPPAAGGKNTPTATPPVAPAKP
ncbi:MAG: hypothetical protein DVB26_04600 [Verrucomicrobia bacterium]|nr:MAG: hypothetical protein DVB26_04600 [Verrucomicrobiota bacterium]